jgi:hypothetical protein
MKKIIVITGIIILCWSLIGCNNSVKNIKAQYFTISYGESLYDAMNKADKETVDLLVNHYNEIEFTGTTSEEINYENAISITFIHNDQVSGNITFDDKGICSLDGKVENYTISKDSRFYKKALEVYFDVKEEYEK